MAFGQMAGNAAQLYGSNLQFQEYDRQFRNLEREERLGAGQLDKRAKFTARKGSQAIQDLQVERGETLGTIRAGQAKSGIKATGSAALRSKRTASRYDQQVERLGEDVQFKVEEIEFEADRSRRRADELRRQRGSLGQAQTISNIGGIFSLFS